MGDTVAPRERASVGHFESGGRHYEGTPAEQASEVAALPTLIVGSELCHDDVFMGLAGEADGDPQLAYALAVRYARRGAPREAVAAMLVEASPTADSPVRPINRLMNMGRNNGCFVDAPLQSGDAVNALQQARIATLHRGARFLVLRGRRECLQCEARLAADNRGLHCSAHRAHAGSDLATLTSMLRDVAEQIGIPADGSQARRIRRNV
jgi:hypothetical protein